MCRLREVAVPFRNGHFHSDSPSPSAEGGYAILLLVVVFMLLGASLLGVLSHYVAKQREAREVQTELRLKQVSRVLATYVQRHNRIPCPANPDRAAAIEPFGVERNTHPVTGAYGWCDDTQYEGILPFRTLGISEEDAKDGWGRFLTYRVNPVFTLDPTDPALTVHQSCRRIGLWFEGLVIGGGGGAVTFEDNGVIDLAGFKAVWIGGDGSDVNIINQPNAIRFQNNDLVRIGGGTGGNVRIINNSMGFQTTDNKRIEIGGNGNIEISNNNNVRLQNNDAVVFGAGGNLIIANNNTVRIDDILDDRFADGRIQSNGTIQAPNGSVNIAGNTHVSAIGFEGNLNSVAGNGNVQITGNNIVNLKGTGTVDTLGSGSPFTNTYPEKARFCCADIAALEVLLGPAPSVLDVNGDPLVQTVAPATGFASANDTASVAPSLEIPSAPAFVIISHGANGGGAFIESGARLSTAGLSPNEILNANGDGVFIAGPRLSPSGEADFDDIVIWRTQDQLYAEGGSSCDTPF